MRVSPLSELSCLCFHEGMNMAIFTGGNHAAAAGGVTDRTIRFRRDLSVIVMVDGPSQAVDYFTRKK